MKTFLEKFTSLFDESPILELRPETKFKDLEEWDSLTALSLIIMISDDYGKKLGGDDIARLTTIEDLFNFVN